MVKPVEYLTDHSELGKLI